MLTLCSYLGVIQIVASLFYRIGFLENMRQGVCSTSAFGLCLHYICTTDGAFESTSSSVILILNVTFVQNLFQ